MINYIKKIKIFLHNINRLNYNFYKKRKINVINTLLYLFCKKKNNAVIPFIGFKNFSAKNSKGLYPWSLNIAPFDYIVEGINIFNPYIYPFFAKYTAIGFKFMNIYMYLYNNYPNSWITRWLIRNTVIGTLRYTYLGEIIAVRSFLKFKNIVLISYILDKSNYSSVNLTKLDLSIGQDLRSKKEGDYYGCYPAKVCFDVLAFAPINSVDWYSNNKCCLYITTIKYP